MFLIKPCRRLKERPEEGVLASILLFQLHGLFIAEDVNIRKHEESEGQVN